MKLRKFSLDKLTLFIYNLTYIVGSLVSNPKKIVIKGVGFYYIGNKNLGVFRTGGHLQKTQIQSLPKKVRQISFPKRFIKGDIKKMMHIWAAPSQRGVKDTPMGAQVSEIGEDIMRVKIKYGQSRALLSPHCRENGKSPERGKEGKWLIAKK